MPAVGRWSPVRKKILHHSLDTTVYIRSNAKRNDSKSFFFFFLNDRAPPEFYPLPPPAPFPSPAPGGAGSRGGGGPGRGWAPRLYRGEDPRARLLFGLLERVPAAAGALAAARDVVATAARD